MGQLVGIQEQRELDNGTAAGGGLSVRLFFPLGL
jgi:hypothetical protein